MFKILLATDGSPGANRAVEYTAKLCEGRADAEVTALYVKDLGGGWGVIVGDPKEMIVPDVPGLQESFERAAQQALSSAQNTLQKTGRRVNLRTEAGRAHEVIARIAETENFDQVVMGKRGLGAIAGLLMGSVSERVTRMCKVPVTVVHE